jgi:drug/metabolite transporter (DMT)-like permease
MVTGVFVARWTFPTLLKGTQFVVDDLNTRRHLIVWAVIAGALWAIANTLTVFAIRDVGLAVAFPLWNANGLVGLIWGRVLFGELKGAPGSIIFRVVVGALLITFAASMLAFSAMHTNRTGGSHAVRGVVAAFGACLLWGTMYVPYRKAYLSGMNPLSFVTVFTVGELVTVAAAAVGLGGGFSHVAQELQQARGLLFWLFLGGFVWVVGDLFQQFTAKYLGIGRGISLANTNQLWGLAWAALVFGELRGAGWPQLLLVIGGSVGMIAGVTMIGSGQASGKERTSQEEAILRECDRYNLNYSHTLDSMAGVERGEKESTRRWWDYLIMVVAVAFFVWTASSATLPSLGLNRLWIGILGAASMALLAAGVVRLWRTTGFS